MPNESTEAVVAHYLAVHPRRRIGPKDRAAVAKALTLGYTSDELCAAIDGNAGDEWHRKVQKHELPYVLRDTGKIDDFRAKVESRLMVDPATGLPTADGAAILRGA